MFYRNSLKYLKEWAKSTNHKPLIIRGARQVGKTELVRMFAKEEFTNFVEINFDHPDNKSFTGLFQSQSPQEILTILEIHFKTKITAGHTLLFFDEVQNVPELLPALRYFYEDLPDLHVIAAGSLLEFILNEHDFSMPVGRIDYLHLGQMTFEEFLLAQNENQLYEFIHTCSITADIPQPFHERLLKFVKLYFVLGGMPEVVLAHSQNQDFENCFKIQSQILATYQDDFYKYKKRLNQVRLRNVFQKIPLLVGQKIKYVNIDPHEQSKSLATALDLLCLARVCARIYHSSGQGIPLRAQMNPRVFKILFLDIGLMNQSCGTNYLEINTAHDLTWINQGALTEQFIGQHLLYLQEPYLEPEVFYWQREKNNAAAEVDYLVSHKNLILPVEVKSGKTGRLKSISTFLLEHPGKFALRFNGDVPSLVKMKISDSQKQKEMILISLPFYLVEQTHRLLEESLN